MKKKKNKKKYLQSTIGSPVSKDGIRFNSRITGDDLNIEEEDKKIKISDRIKGYTN